MRVDGGDFVLVVEIVVEGARVLAAEVLGDDCNIHLLGQEFEDLIFFRADNGELTDGSLGEERLEHSP